MKVLIDLQQYFKDLNRADNYIFENCFIDKDYFNPALMGFNFDYIYNVVYIYKGVELNGYLRGQKQPNDINYQGNIWGFYPNAQNDFIWSNFDEYQTIKKEMLNKYYIDDKTVVRHCHLGSNALSKALIELIDRKLNNS
jgi:hypothetical protein